MVVREVGIQVGEVHMSTQLSLAMSQGTTYASVHPALNSSGMWDPSLQSGSPGEVCAKPAE